eukprot:Skav223375  [mRNA]  locus=scaffold1536:221253:222023:+ [translate_table: standard]
MLDQMAAFDLRNAKCTLETDRRAIEEQVLSLWDEALEPPVSVAFGAEEIRDQEESLLPEISPDIRHITSYPSNNEIIDQFNVYVRGPLRENVLEWMGKEDQVSLRLCSVATLPWLWLSVLSVLSCDGRTHCEASSSHTGFPSAWQYAIIGIVYWGCLAPMVAMTEFQLILFSCKWVQLKVSEHDALRTLLGSGLCAVVMFLCDQIFFAQRGILVVTVAMYEPHWLASAIACAIFDVCLVWMIFCSRKTRSQRTLLR